VLGAAGDAPLAGEGAGGEGVDEHPAVEAAGKQAVRCCVDCGCGSAVRVWGQVRLCC